MLFNYEEEEESLELELIFHTNQVKQKVKNGIRLWLDTVFFFFP